MIQQIVTLFLLVTPTVSGLTHDEFVRILQDGDDTATSITTCFHNEAYKSLIVNSGQYVTETKTNEVCEDTMTWDIFGHEWQVSFFGHHGWWSSKKTTYEVQDCPADLQCGVGGNSNKPYCEAYTYYHWFWKKTGTRCTAESPFQKALKCRNDADCEPSWQCHGARMWRGKRGKCHPADKLEEGEEGCYHHDHCKMPGHCEPLMENPTTLEQSVGKCVIDETQVLTTPTAVQCNSPQTPGTSALNSRSAR
jgi:hypothetical protein